MKGDLVSAVEAPGGFEEGSLTAANREKRTSLKSVGVEGK